MLKRGISFARFFQLQSHKLTKYLFKCDSIGCTCQILWRGAVKAFPGLHANRCSRHGQYVLPAQTEHMFSNLPNTQSKEDVSEKKQNVCALVPAVAVRLAVCQHASTKAYILVQAVLGPEDCGHGRSPGTRRSTFTM